MKAISSPVPSEVHHPNALSDRPPTPNAPRAAKPSTLSWGLPPKPKQPPPTTDEVLHIRCPEADLPEHVEQDLIIAIVRPLLEGETRQDGNARREREILAIVATLSPAQAFRLGARIDNAYSNDPIVVALQRLIGERRKRLREALDEHRRLATKATWAKL